VPDMSRPLPSRPTRWSRRLSAAVVGLLSAASLWLVPGTAHAAGPEYVALGDSYASGVGTREYYGDSGECRRSPHAYAVENATRLGATLSFQACSGARVSEVTGQLGALDAATRYVTVQVGGNDAGFTDVITECALPAWAQDCEGAVASARTIIDQQLPGRLRGLYAQIAQRSPSATVVVVGYPRIFHDEDCNAATWFSPADRQLLNDTADLLNARISAQAAAAGFAYADPTSAFLGHAVCDEPEWINGLSNPIIESYHPNRAGQDGYAALVAGLLN
jgi:lysophospholipase L1-like esterase